MRLFKCRGCEAKDSEILHLYGQLDKLQTMVEAGQKRLAELAEPGIALRLAGAANLERRPVTVPTLEERQKRRARMVAGFPGYGPEPRKAPGEDVEIDE